MDVLDQNIRQELVTWHEKLFSRSIRRKEKLARLKESLGSTIQHRCLLISSGDAMIAQKLRQSGTVWSVLAMNDAAANGLSGVLGEEVHSIKEGRLLFDDNAFDTVVISDALEYVESDYEFVKECHRVLKSTGGLVVTVDSLRGYGLIRGLRQLVGPTDSQAGRYRPGYTSRQLFDLFKDGFDVPGITRYSGFFTEFSAIGSALMARLTAGARYEVPPEEVGRNLFYKYRSLNIAFALGYVFMWFSTVLDKVTIFLPRYKLIAKTKPRTWRSRATPKLKDGRSLAEAALNTKIGTAVEF